MPVTYLKKAVCAPLSDEHDTRAAAARMLSDIETGGEREPAGRLDGWTDGPVLGPWALVATGRRLPESVTPDLRDTHERRCSPGSAWTARRPARWPRTSPGSRAWRGVP
jgi:hypothetical protein